MRCRRRGSRRVPRRPALASREKANDSVRNPFPGKRKAIGGDAQQSGIPAEPVQQGSFVGDSSVNDVWIALLGWRDEPTDGLADYCRYLGEALAPMGHALEIARVPWAERGWPPSLAAFPQMPSACRRLRILVQSPPPT